MGRDLSQSLLRSIQCQYKGEQRFCLIVMSKFCCCYSAQSWISTFSFQFFWVLAQIKSWNGLIINVGCCEHRVISFPSLPPCNPFVNCSNLEFYHTRESIWSNFEMQFTNWHHILIVVISVYFEGIMTIRQAFHVIWRTEFPRKL